MLRNYRLTSKDFADMPQIAFDAAQLILKDYLGSESASLKQTRSVVIIRRSAESKSAIFAHESERKVSH